MTTSISALSTVQTAIQGHTAAGTVAPVTGSLSLGTRSLTLPGGLAANLPTATDAGLNIEEVKTALDLAVSAGQTIVSALESLKAAIAIADHSSLVSPSAALTIDGYRISRVNIESQAKLIGERVDALVDAAEFRGANLVSSTAPNIALQTSSFGGSVTITPQPLDFTGLGIDNLDLLTEGGIEVAKAKVETAIHLATVRTGRLTALRKALNNPDTFSAGFARIVNGGATGVLPRGSVVDLQA